MGIIINGQNDTIGPVDNSMSLLGTVSIGGTMTIEDFTNIDSVGLITARNGLHVTGGNLLLGRTTDYWSSRSVVQEDKNGRTHLLVKNDNNHASASAGITLNAFGNSWAIDCGSHPNNTNALTFGLDASAGSPAEKLCITSAGDMGLGTATPTSFGPTLQVAGTDPALLLQDTATAVDYFGVNVASGVVNTWFDDASAFVIHTATGISGSGLVERFRIRSDGRVTIGTQTINTNSMLSIHRSSSDESQIRFTNTTTGEGGNNGLLVGIDSNEHGRIFNQENSPLRFGTDNTERLRIRAQGPHLLIGTGGDATYNEITESSSNAGLVIGSSSMGNGGIVIRNSTSGTGRIYFADNSGSDPGRQRGQINYYHNNDSMMFATAGSERLSIRGNGDFHISWNDGQFVGQYYDANYYMGLTFASNAREMYIDNKTNDTRADIVLRTLNGSGTPAQRLRVASDGNTTLGYGGASLYFQNGFNNSASRIQNGGGSNNSNLKFYTISSGSEAERLRIQSDGNVIPMSTGAYNLGIDGNRWNKVWTNYVRYGTRSATYEKTFTATSDGSGNITFDCGMLWLVDDSSFEVFCHMDRTGAHNSIAARYKFYGSKVSGFGTQGTYRYDTSNFYIISPLSNPSITHYTPTGFGSAHGTRISHTSAVANAQYRLTMLINWVGQQEVT